MTAPQLVTQERSLDSYLILPETRDHPDLLVTADKLYRDKDWHQAHEALHKEGSFMLPLREFLDFLNRVTGSPRNVCDGTGKRIGVLRTRRIERDIFQERNPSWKAEHIDARFFMFDGRLYIGYNHRTVGGYLQAMNSEPLERCLMKEGYIDLRSINRQGLPTRRSRKEEIYFFPPGNGTVARFVVDSSNAGLGCDGGLSDSGSELGVRAVKIRQC